MLATPDRPLCAISIARDRTRARWCNDSWRTSRAFLEGAPSQGMMSK